MTRVLMTLAAALLAADARGAEPQYRVENHLAAAAPAPVQRKATAAADDRIAALETEVAELRKQVKALRDANYLRNNPKSAAGCGCSPDCGCFVLGGPACGGAGCPAAGVGYVQPGGGGVMQAAPRVLYYQYPDGRIEYPAGVSGLGAPTGGSCATGNCPLPQRTGRR